MSENRTGRRASQRAFRPTLDGQLETRFLLAGGVRHAALAAGDPPLQFQTANGGRAVVITDVDGAQFEVTVTSDLQTADPHQITAGVVRAHALPGGKVAITAFGTTVDSIVAINPLVKRRAKGGAHNFAAGQAVNDSILHIGSIKIASGKVSEIVGYRSADLSGPVSVLAKTAINRIAFESLLPGASITTGGDLNTLDVLNSINLAGGPSITVGRDLNWINTNGDLTLNTGSSLIVGRDIGLVAQAAKGTGPPGQGGFVGGNLVIGPGSKISIGRSLAAPFVVNGNGTGMSRVMVGTPLNNFVFRPGATVTP
jgi:hypothetical protein